MISNRPRPILIVEDDAALASLMASVLNDAGYVADVVPSPDVASGVYDLVVADYMAPSYVPGKPWPYVHKLRDLANGGPILGCTGHRDALGEDPVRLGINAITVKPFDVDEFVQLVDNLLAEYEPRGVAPSDAATE